MSGGKIVLYTFIAILIAGGVLAVYFMTDTIGLGGSNKMFFGPGEIYEVNDIKELDLNGVRKIEILVSSTDTSLELVDSQKVKASLTGSVRTTDPSYVPYLEARVIGSTLRIEIKRKSSMVTGSYSSNANLVVEIPKAFKDDLAFNGTSSNVSASGMRLNSCSFNTSSGDIILGSMEVNAAFVAGATSGRIEVEKLQAASAKMTSSSGDTVLGDIAVQDDFSAEATSGNISIDKLDAANASLKNSSGDKKIAVMTVSGKVILEGSSGTNSLDRVSTGQLVIHSTSGDVGTNSVHSGQTTIKTSSGRILVKGFEGDADLFSTSGDVTLLCDKPASSIQIECSSGNINLGLPDNTQFSVNAQTSSGNMKTDFPLDQTSASGKHLQGSTGNGALEVSMKTTSGNIKITKN